MIGWLLLGMAFEPGMPLLWAGRTDPVEKDITQKKKDLKDIKKEITVTKEKEKEIRGQESSVLESLSQIETELYQKEKELKQMEARLGQTKEKSTADKGSDQPAQQRDGTDQRGVLLQAHRPLQNGANPSRDLSLHLPILSRSLKDRQISYGSSSIRMPVWSIPIDIRWASRRDTRGA